MKTDAQKRASDKYDKLHFVTIGTRLKLETANAFRAYAAANSTTVNALLSGFVDDCLSGSTQQPHSSTGTGEN